MSYLLFLLAIGLATALALVFKQLQQRQHEYAVVQQRLKETGRRLQEADQKYGGLISKEETIRELDIQIAALTDKRRQVSKQAETEEHEIRNCL